MYGPDWPVRKFLENEAFIPTTFGESVFGKLALFREFNFSLDVYIRG